jgi:hypothetical protein
MNQQMPDFIANAPQMRPQSAIQANTGAPINPNAPGMAEAIRFFLNQQGGGGMGHVPPMQGIPAPLTGAAKQKMLIEMLRNIPQEVAPQQ